MRLIQKLVRNGNSTQVTIPRPVQMHLGWLPGEAVVLTVLEDRSLRIQRLDDVVQTTARGVGLLAEPPVSVK